MEQFIAFLTSQVGQILCYVLIFVGVTDILIVRLVFGNIIKKNEQLILPTMSPEQKKIIEKKIDALQLAMKIITISAVAFIAVAVFGLTR